MGKTHAVSDRTAQDIAVETSRLELAAATLLGQTLFEFGRLEMELALFLVSSDGGRQIEFLTEQLAEDGLHAKLCRLEKVASANYADNPQALQAFQGWLRAAHDARLQRNEFIHGRWGVAAMAGQVVNVIGIPTSTKQREVRYSLPQLETCLDAFKALRPRLRQLRETWPL
jgi:hypothetical protein